MLQQCGYCKLLLLLLQKHVTASCVCAATVLLFGGAAGPLRSRDIAGNARVYIYIYIYIYSHTHTCIYIYIYTLNCMCIRICKYICVSICICAAGPLTFRDIAGKAQVFFRSRFVTMETSRAVFLCLCYLIYCLIICVFAIYIYIFIYVYTHTYSLICLICIYYMLYVDNYISLAIFDMLFDYMC